MKVLVDLCIVPIGVGVSLSTYIAACEKVLAEAGLKTALHSYGTNIEGEWDDVFAAIRRCHETVHAMGAPRITTSAPASSGSCASPGSSSTPPRTPRTAASRAAASRARRARWRR